MAGCSIEHHKRLDIGIRQLTGNYTAYLIKLVHEICLVVQSPCGVDDYSVSTSCLCGADAVIHYRCGVAALLMADDVRSRALCPNVELLACGGTEGVACAQKHLFAVGFKSCRELADGRRLADTVNANHEDDRRLGLKLERGVHIAEHLMHVRNERFFCVSALIYPVAVQNALIVVEYLCGSLPADIGHDEHFLKLIVKVHVVHVVVLEYLLEVLNIFAGLSQSRKHLIKKAHHCLLITDRFLSSAAPAQGRARLSLKRPFPAW